MSALVDVLLGAVDWKRQRTGAMGTAESVPEALHGLVASRSDDEALRYYWELDNRVVVQGQLFSSAIALIPVLLCALLADVKESARYWLMELVMQIAGGESHASETDSDLGRAARSALREGLWVVYAQLLDASPRVRATAVDLLAILDLDSSRVAAVVGAHLGDDSSEEVKRAVARLER